MKKVMDLINQNVSRGKKSLIFTQSNDLVRSFLYENPGKWTIKINEKCWPKSIIMSDKHDKVKVVEMGQQIGLDCIGTDVIFSKKPCLRPDPRWSIIQTHYRSPIVFFEERPQRTELMKDAALFTDRPEKFQNMFDVLPEDHGRPALISSYLRYCNTNHAIIMKQFCDPLDLCMLHDVGSIHVASSTLWHQMPTIHQCQSVMASMSMIAASFGKGAAVDADWVSRHAIINAFAIPRVLALLSAMKCVQEIVKDMSTVVVQKKPPCPATIEFGNIPEGTFELNAIKKLLGDDALRILKSYEGNGLVFGFNERKHSYYRPIKDVSREDYHDVTETLIGQTQRWSQIINSAKWLNSVLHESVRRMYQSHECYMTNEDMTEIEKVGEVVNVAL